MVFMMLFLVLVWMEGLVFRFVFVVEAALDVAFLKTGPHHFAAHLSVRGHFQRVNAAW